jgi:hypothetical protein
MATRTAAIAGVREVADGAGSARWSDTWIKTVLGIVHYREWEQILAANPTYRFAQRSVTSSAAGVFAYTDLNSGSGNTLQTVNKILSITDGQAIYHQTEFKDAPLATSVNYAATQAKAWYDAGTNVQILPVGAVALTVSVNYTPCRVDNLALDADSIDFPDGSEVILYLEAAAFILSKGGMENDTAQMLRAMAQEERQSMYNRIARRAARPQFLGFPDSASDWGG